MRRSLAKKKPVAGEPITIKKYANRRLYNTATSSYVTLEDLATMVREGQDFLVHDAKTSEDLTRSVLTQIIFEQEQKGHNLLPVPFLRQLISFYGDSLQGFVPSYLEMSMNTFSEERSKLVDKMTSAFGGKERFDQFEEQIRRNISMFEEAIRMFSPFALRSDNNRGEKSADAEKAAAGEGDDLETVKQQLKEIQKELAALSGKEKEK
ncbi:polyhydroxyalkanoate synthesis repressor PhaR [Parvibaculaceae bacterium PLY_AMNH_Bact1]|nr:polyhydroxyalkanoate synthesis repressor PhaR [Parvibaculaceae bacterium PLY_AMNH_Bact1]